MKHGDTVLELVASQAIISLENLSPKRWGTRGTGRDEPALGRQVVHFGVFELDSKAGELRRAGLKVKLQQQPFQILRLPLEHAGEDGKHLAYEAVTNDSNVWMFDNF